MQSRLPIVGHVEGPGSRHWRVAETMEKAHLFENFCPRCQPGVHHSLALGLAWHLDRGGQKRPDWSRWEPAAAHVSALASPWPLGQCRMTDKLNRSQVTRQRQREVEVPHRLRPMPSQFGMRARLGGGVGFRAGLRFSFIQSCRGRLRATERSAALRFTVSPSHPIKHPSADSAAGMQTWALLQRRPKGCRSWPILCLPITGNLNSLTV